MKVDIFLVIGIVGCLKNLKFADFLQKFQSVLVNHLYCRRERRFVVCFHSLRGIRRPLGATFSHRRGSVCIIRSTLTIVAVLSSRWQASHYAKLETLSHLGEAYKTSFQITEF